MALHARMRSNNVRGLNTDRLQEVNVIAIIRKYWTWGTMGVLEVFITFGAIGQTFAADRS